MLTLYLSSIASVEIPVCANTPVHQNRQQAPQQPFLSILCRENLFYLQSLEYLLPERRNLHRWPENNNIFFLCREQLPPFQIFFLVPSSNEFHTLIVSCVNNVPNISFPHLRSTSSYIVGVKRYPCFCFTLLFCALYSSIILCLTIRYCNTANFKISDFSVSLHADILAWICHAFLKLIQFILYTFWYKGKRTKHSAAGRMLSTKWWQWFLVFPDLFFINAIFLCLFVC